MRNILANPEVALLINRYEEDWSRLGYILIRGTARRVEPGEGGHDEAVGLLRDRYPQYRSMALEIRPVIAIGPEHVTLGFWPGRGVA